MKGKLFKLAIAAIMVIGASLAATNASAQVYVTVRPTYAPVVRTVAPSPAHVWVEEDWAYRGGHYVAVGGHWVAPPRPGMVWIPGRWVQSRRGWHWIPGHWRRR